LLLLLLLLLQCIYSLTMHPQLPTRDSNNEEFVVIEGNEKCYMLYVIYIYLCSHILLAKCMSEYRRLAGSKVLPVKCYEPTEPGSIDICKPVNPDPSPFCATNTNSNPNVEVLDEIST